MLRRALPLGVALALLLALPCAIARPDRSPSVRAEFMRLHPCPSTGKPRGACPGWQVDHITPLKCGGADAVGNLQWLTIQAHKDKTKAEAKLCRKRG